MMTLFQFPLVITLATVVMFMPVGALGQQFFKCVDASGKTIFSDRGCDSNQTGKRMNLPPVNSFDGAYYRQRAQQENLNTPKDDKPSVVMIGDTAEERSRKATCEQARRELILGSKSLTAIDLDRLNIMQASCDERDRKAICDQARRELTLGSQSLTAIDFERINIMSASCGPPGTLPPRPRLTHDDPAVPAKKAPAEKAPAKDMWEPTRITNCNSGGCWDNSGNRYNTDDGKTYYPSFGGVCRIIGNRMSCN